MTQYIDPQSRSGLLGAIADVLGAAKRGTGLLGDVIFGGAPEMLDRASYGQPPVTFGSTSNGLLGAVYGMHVDPGIVDAASLVAGLPGVTRMATLAGKEGLSLIDAGMMGQNQLMSKALNAVSPNFMLKNTKTPFGGGKYQALDVPVQWDASTPSTALTLNDGSLTLNVNPALRTDRNWIRQRGVPEAVDEFLWPFDGDVYIRNGGLKDYEYLVSGTHRGSVNHIDGSPESGLSVTRNTAYPSESAYLVRGNRINRGSDNEPVLDMTGLSAASSKMTAAAMSEMYRHAVAAKAQRLGLSDEDLRLIKSSLNPVFP